MGFSIYIRIERGLDPDLNPGGKTIKQITPTRYFKQIYEINKFREIKAMIKNVCYDKKVYFSFPTRWSSL